MITFDTKYLYGIKDTCCMKQDNIESTQLKGFYKCAICKRIFICKLKVRKFG